MGFLDKLKGMAGKAKDTADDAVAKNSDKIPGKIAGTYNKVSDAAEKHIPGADTPSPSEKIIKGDDA